jgi:hypothetical protein
MKKLTRKETKTVLIGIEMSGKEFLECISDSLDAVSIKNIFHKGTDNEIEFNSRDTINIDGRVTILFNEDDWTEGLPEV